MSHSESVQRSTLQHDRVSRRFRVAFSFAGEQRELLRATATVLRSRLPDDSIFFDEWFEALLAGHGMDLKLHRVYSELADLVVVGVSGEYGKKGWTQTEHEAIRGRLLKCRQAPAPENDELWLLPIRVGDGDVPGIPSNAMTPDVRARSAEQVAQLILDRLALLPGMQTTYVGRRASLSSGASKLRERYLKEARRDVQSRLDASIHHARFIDLGLEDEPSAIQPAWGYHDAATKRAYTSIDEAFDANDGRLLILGRPGSGKTTTLLHLAKRLLDAAQRDEQAPIPFLINLSKFRLDRREPSAKGAKPSPSMADPDSAGLERDLRLEHWLIQELTAFPNLSAPVARAWLDEGRLALLLDGLDEFDDERRAELVKLMNDGLLRADSERIVVVCSRTTDYEPLKGQAQTRLQLRAAIELQPLSDADISSYLEASRAPGLLAALSGDEVLQEMARTPLTLCMLVLAYGGDAPPEGSAAMPLTQRRHRLFESFVARMLQRQARRAQGRPFDDLRLNDVPVSEYRYSPAQVDRYLGWLAIMLSVRMRTAFSLTGIHGLLSVRPTSKALGFDFWAVYLARGAFAATMLALIGVCLIPFTPDALRELGLLMLGIWAVTPLGAAVAGNKLLAQLLLAPLLVVGSAAAAQALALLLSGRISPVALAAVVSVLIGGQHVLLEATRKLLRAVRYTSLAALISYYAIHATMVTVPSGPLSMLAWLTGVTSLAAMVFVYVYRSRAAEKAYSWATRLRRFMDSLSGAYILSCLMGSSAGAAWVFEFKSSDLHLLMVAIALASVAISLEVSQAFGLLLGAACLAGLSRLLGSAGAVPALGVFSVSCILVLNASGSPQSERSGWLDRVAAGVRARAAPTLDAIERYFLSRIILWLAALFRRLPPSAHAFLEFGEEAFLIKRASTEFEFVHRLLRDYFAIRELLPKTASHSPERLNGIRALGYQGESALARLTELSEDPDPKVRATAVSALGHVFVPEVEDWLKRRFHDPAPEVRRALLGVILAERYAGTRDQMLMQLVPLGDCCELEPMLEFVKRDHYSAYSLAPFLFRMGISAYEPLVAGLDSRDRLVRRASAVMLPYLMDHRAVAPLLEHLNDKVADVRHAIVDALGQLGDAEAVAPLIARLRHKDPETRDRVVSALSSLQDVRAVEPLIACLEDKVHAVRLAAVSALATMGDLHCVEPLLQLLGDKAAQIRQYALFALGQLERRRVSEMTESGLRSRVLDAMRARLEDEDAEVRVAAATQLHGVHDEAGLFHLLQLAHDIRQEIRLGAIAALAQGLDQSEKILLHDVHVDFAWRDPDVPITLADVSSVAEFEQKSPEEVRELYEHLAARFGLRLEWKPKGASGH